VVVLVRITVEVFVNITVFLPTVTTKRSLSDLNFVTVAVVVGMVLVFSRV
jgi:hypothetical protein